MLEAALHLRSSQSSSQCIHRLHKIPVYGVRCCLGQHTVRDLACASSAASGDGGGSGAGAHQKSGVPVDAELIDLLADLFPVATGRDIKGLTKLVAKYCSHKQTAPTLAVWKRCSMFRGMELGAVV